MSYVLQSQAFPNLQSIVIVLLKEILINITESASLQSKMNGQNSYRQRWDLSVRCLLV